MSEIMTVCHLRGAGGYQDWGRLTRAEIIKKTREWAACEKERADKILNAPDDAFDCKIVRGPLAQRLIERLPA